MNKKIIAFAAAGLFLTASCKKDWTCNCTYTDPITNQSVSVPSEILDSKKKDAEDACDALTASISILGTGASCELE